MKPRESTTISTIYRTANLPGPFKKIVTISTDAADQSEIEITLEGQVKEKPCAKIQVTPRRVDLGVLKVGTETKQSVTITNVGTLPLEISKISGKENNTIHFEGKLVIAPGASVSQEVVFKASQRGPFTETILIQSNARNVTRAGFIVLAKGTVEE